ncbi:MAG: hypothetical protein UE295_06590 [Acutalibacteraceae bacterium]|nr:hypothetical protein [Acutalibacteraceae bacterium]
MSHNPNTIKSQDELSTTNDGKRSSDVLLSTIEELEKTKKQLDIAKSFIFRCENDIAGDWYVNAAKCVMQKIEELNK